MFKNGTQVHEYSTDGTIYPYHAFPEVLASSSDVITIRAVSPPIGKTQIVGIVQQSNTILSDYLENPTSPNGFPYDITFTNISGPISGNWFGEAQYF